MTLDVKQLGFMLGAIPGSVAPSIWDIRHSHGMQASVDLTHHVANLPGALTIWDAAVQQHEQGHIRWDLPTDKLGALAPALVMPSVVPWYKMMREWVIDLRLVLGMDATAVDPRIGMDRFDWTQMPDPKTRSEETVGQWWCQYAYVFTGSQSAALQNYTGELWGLLTDPTRNALSEAFTQVTDRANAYNDDVSAAWAIKLAAMFDKARTSSPSTPPATQEYTESQQKATTGTYATIIKAGVIKEALASQGNGASQADQEQAKAVAASMSPQVTTGDPTGGAGSDVAATFGQGKQQAPKASSTTQSGTAKRGKPDRTAWGSRVVVCNHLSTARSGKRLKAPKGASEEGVVIVDLPRVFQDRRPFRNAPRPAGTIIVDTSSSMSWTQEELEEIIRRCPNVVVALYNASGAPDVRDKYGLYDSARICIVARDGRSAKLEDVMNAHAWSGGNGGSDAAALEWLADRHQKGPKFILSDGEFHQSRGVNWRYAEEVCAAIMKAGHILRVPTLKDMVLIANHRPAQISSGSTYQSVTRRRANNG
jgi:hypothetical protein